MDTPLDDRGKEQKTTLQSYLAKPTDDDSSFSDMLKFYCCPLDTRYEDLCQEPWKAIIRDIMAGLVVAMVAIPMAMGFAMASGLQPAQGIVGGAMAGLIGALFGGSKYQSYGPSAAFIPVMNGIMALNMEGGPLYIADVGDEEVFRRGHGLLVFISILAAAMLLALGLARAGTLVSKIPQCIVVGFTIGIAVTIAFALSEEALGIKKLGAYHGFWPKIVHLYDNLGHANGYAFAIAVGTLICTLVFSQVSVFIPGALLAIHCSTVLAQTVWSSKHLNNVFDSYGHIPQVNQTFAFTPPAFYLGDVDAVGNVLKVLGLTLYYAIQIAFIGAVESLLCARMADDLAGNKGTALHPNKELWGQGLVNAIVPLFNAFPHAGALARTSINVKLGAVTPLAGIMKCFLKLSMAFACARWLEMIPMASIAGLLWYVAISMIPRSAMAEVHAEGGWPHVSAMWATAIAIIFTDFLKGCAIGMLIYALGFFLEPYLPETVCGCCLRGDSEIGTDEEKAAMLKHASA